MKATSKVLLFLILILAFGLTLNLTMAKGGALEENLFVLHKDLSKMKMKDCVGCHDVLNETSLDRNIKTAHVIHAFFGPDGCLACHQDFDVNQDSGQALRKQVDMEICLGCHVRTEKGWEVSSSRANK